MKILILGRGVIGSQYGWALENAGNTVDFFVRKSSRHTYADYIELHTYDGRTKKNIDTKWDINLKYEISPEEKYDLILISVNPVDSIDILPKYRFVVSFPSAGGGITENVLNGILYGSVQIGASSDALSSREQMVKELFESAGFKVSVHKDIDAFLWNHYVLNAAMETEVLKHGSFEAVITSKDGLASMMRNVKDMIPYLKAKGITPDLPVRAMSILPANIIASLMMLTMYKPGTPAYNAVAFNKYAVGHSVRQICEDAHKLGVSLLRIESAL